MDPVNFRFQRRQFAVTHFPCPRVNPPQIGDVQKFDVYCGMEAGGVEISRMRTDSLIACAKTWYVSVRGSDLPYLDSAF